MAVLHSEFQLYNPFRDPAWRYRRVDQLLVANRRPSRLKDDSWTHQAWKFFRKWNLARSNEEREEKVFPLNPGMYFAMLFHQHPDQEWRVLLESNILSRLNDDRIASGFATMPPAVYWYERLFYDIRERLHSKTHIVKTIEGTLDQRAANAEGSITAFQQSVMYRMFAYFGGPLALDLIVTGFNEHPIPRRASDMAEWSEEIYSTLIVRQGMIAGKTLTQNKFNVVQVIQMSNQVVEQAKHMRLHGGPKLELEQNIEEALKNTPLLVYGDDADMIKLPYKVDPHDIVELRAGEQLLMTRGVKPNTLSDDDRTALREKINNVKPAKDGTHGKVLARE